MDPLAERVRRITREWQALQAELAAASRPALPDPDLQLVRDFKKTVDDIRTFLWSYLQSTDRHSDLGETLQATRMQRTAEMLRELAQDAQARPAGPEPEMQSFFEMIQAVADDAVRKHCSSPGGAAGGEGISSSAAASNP